jgi:branched-chain amino acid transport system permease protein
VSEVWLQLLNGLFVGMSLALVAAGLALVFGVLRVVNFAQGELVMLGAYAVVFVTQATGNFAIGVVGATVVVGVVGGLVLYLVVRPLLGRSPILPVLATLGLSFVLRQFAQRAFGGFIRTINQPISLSVPVQGLQYPVYDLLIAVVSFLALAGGYLFLKRAPFGIWLRAAADNSAMAEALGAPMPRVYLFAFMLSAGLSALAGAMLAPVTAVYASLGQDISFMAFVVVVAAGLGNFSFRRAALFAVLLGQIQALGSIWFRPVAVQVFAIVLVIGVMLYRARGRPLPALTPSLSGVTSAVSQRIVAVGVLAIAILALVLGGGYAQRSTSVLSLVLLGAAVAIMLHFGGVFNVGMGAVFGASAYALALLSRTDTAPEWLLGGAVLAACAAALAYGAYANFASGIEYMMLTFLTTVAAAKLPNLVPALSGGANGLGVRDVASAAFGNDPLDGAGFYQLALILAAVCLVGCGFVLSSQAGRVARAVAHNPLRTASMGYRTGDFRVLVALLAGLLAGLAGWMYGLQSRVVGQDVLGLDTSLLAVVYALPVALMGLGYAARRPSFTPRGRWSARPRQSPTD